MKYVSKEDLPILEALKAIEPNSSRGTREKWLKKCRVFVDGKLVKKTNTKVKKGQTVSLGEKQIPIEKGLKKIYEDAHFVVVFKPAGLLSVSTAFEKEETAFGIVKRLYAPSKIYVLHRLDQETSGLLLFAKTIEAKDKIKKLFENHEVKREYIAIVEGETLPEKGTWVDYQSEDSSYRVKSSLSPTFGKKAISHFEVLDQKEGFSALKIDLETGRKNQIRVHCQKAGCPVVGDKKYGSKTNPIKRLGLHAFRLHFFHPFLKKDLHFFSPLPGGFLRLFPKLVMLGEKKR